jgi:hypothetical protein
MYMQTANFPMTIDTAVSILRDTLTIQPDMWQLAESTIISWMPMSQRMALKNMPDQIRGLSILAYGDRLNGSRASLKAAA